MEHVPSTLSRSYGNVETSTLSAQMLSVLHFAKLNQFLVLGRLDKLPEMGLLHCHSLSLFLRMGFYIGQRSSPHHDP